VRPDDERYFERLESQLDAAFDVAREAKRRGDDPEPEVEIPVAKDMADRVENILGIEGVAERVRELEGELSREEAALELVEDFVEGSVGDYDTDAGKIEGAVRTAVALLTEGVVAAPIEGIDRVEVNDDDDGTRYVSVYYAGPIRSAGGTAQALSVLVADYARALLGIEEYEARADEVERYAEEVALYDAETGLQYTPKDKETKFIAEHSPICLDGEATGQEEVSGFRDLERVDTNSPRGGMCLVLAEGIALKAPKIQRYTRDLAEVDWPWLQDLIDGTIGADDGGEGDADGEDTDRTASDGADGDEGTGDDDEPLVEGPPRVDPAEKYLRDLIAGRPVFGHPSRAGGFRLRYGRARNHGFATAGVHPATMHVLDDFLATGTQIKTERPGKAGGVVPVDSIEGPTVKLANGDVRRIDDPAEALELRNGIVDILDAGEYLVNYGEFVENNHPLAPASYVVEWWEQDLAAAGADLQALRDDPHVDLEDPSADEALAWAEEYDAPLHPKYTPLWHDVSVERFDALATAASEGRFVEADGAALSPDGPAAGGDDGDALVVERTETVRATLEALLVEHTQGEEAVTIPDARPLVRSLGLDEELERSWTLADLSERARTWEGGENAVEAVREVAPFTVRERAPTRVGNRMGRPEKSESREMSPAVHTLFPIGEAGGSQRDVSQAASYTDSMRGRAGRISVQVARRECPDCGTRTFKARCPDCRTHTEAVYECHKCGVRASPDESGRALCPRCEGEAEPVETTEVDLRSELDDALAAVGERPGVYDILKGVKGLTSEHKLPEPIEKGILRAKHGVSSFKDGTVRYDMTDLPVTAVRAAELDVSVDQLRELGYHVDVDGDPLRHDDQLVELRVQDVVLSDGAAEHMLKTANFVDALLEQYYGLEPFYDVDDREELVGELVFGMAPHTSAAVVGRVVGFTSAAVGYAHPYFHAAKRRNCFHPETELWYEGDEGWEHGSIEQFVGRYLDESTAETDDFGTLVAQLDGEVRVPSVTADGEPVLKPVEAVSKHVAPDHSVTVETRSGRTLTVTPEHSVLRAIDGSLHEVDARDLSVGDSIPMPKRLDIDGEEYRLDLLDAFIDSGSVPNEDLMIRGLGSDGVRSLLNRATGDEEYLNPVADALGLSDSTVYNWVSRDSVPVGALLDLFDRETLMTTIPKDVTLSVRRDTVAVSRILTIDEDVSRLLGYYAAEGFSRREEGSYHQTTICIPDDEPRADIVETFGRALSVEAFEENEWKVTVSSRLVATLFSEILDTGYDAASKRIPKCVMEAPETHLRAFLRAYFAGDGSASSDRIEVRAHTVSDALKHDLLDALRRFGITAKSHREVRQPTSGAVAEFHDGDAPEYETWVLKIASQNAARFAESVGFSIGRKQSALEQAIESTEPRTQRLVTDGGEVWLDEVVGVRVGESDTEHVYSLTVGDTHTLAVNDLYTAQCDGDEDCVMLLMDGLLNFSKSFLPDKRGGRMDAPLVMSSRIDPTEIDDEAHNMDIVDRYPREFYEATREMVDPGEVSIRIAEETLGTDEEYSNFGHTHDTSDIALGPDLSAYKTLGSMMDKMDAQLELARKLRAVDETDVAERVIEGHFLPDLIGNLRAFSRQETRCLDCGEKYRRMPLTGDCRECGGRVNLTVHQGSVNKYMDTAIHVADEYDCRDYTKQRLEVLERSLESVFENDKNKQSGIADFM
jgi:DNA polymerase II large subunit